MGHTIEMPNALYAALEEAAKDSGTTPVGWIASRLSHGKRPETAQARPDGGAKTLADLFAGRVGRIRSGGQLRLSEDCGEKLTDYVEAKRKAGHL
ncbi:MAG: hypothetical protein GY856_34010 [bacterium]|nr:hypothetical protein [bacterium]